MFHRTLVLYLDFFFPHSIPDPLDGGAGAVAARRPAPPAGRPASPETSLRRLHQVRPRPAPAVPADPGVAGGDAARHAEDNAQRVRAEHEPAAARVGRLPELQLRLAENSRQFSVQYNFSCFLWVSLFVLFSCLELSYSGSDDRP